MDLPKNITQIGVQDSKCKIYVEDYVVSFLKQLNPIARDKTMAAALYGRRKEENEKTYLFVYGAGKLDFIQKETRHLSQAQRQEIERIRRQYFTDYEFLGYRILDGEMVDGFFVCEQEICRYVAGYAQFYENNEAMLTYMLESRQGAAAPESVDSEKYEMVKDRQEKRRAKFVQHKKEEERKEQEEKSISAAGRRGFQVTAATLFLLVALLGVALKTPLLEGGASEWDKLKTEFLDKKLPDVSAEAQADQTEETEGEEINEILKADDKLTEAVQAENRQNEAIPVSGKVAEAGTSKDAAKQSVERPSEAKEETQTSKTQEADPEESKENDEIAETKEQNEVTRECQEETAAAIEKTATSEVTTPDRESAAQPQAYIVCKGDTLSGISIRVYGSMSYVDQICQYNKITNPDEIQIGQKILLP